MQSNDALNDINNIKKIMERSSKFLSLSGLSGVFAGIYAIIGAAFAYKILDWGNARFNFQPNTIYASEHYLFWLILDGVLVLLASVVTAWYFTRQRSKRLGLKMWDNSAKQMFKSFSTPLLVGGIFCLIVLIHHNLVALVAPITLIFYGLALVNASKHSFKELYFLGLCEIALGLIATFIIGYGLYFWTIGFGVLHIIYGALMYFKHR